MTTCYVCSSTMCTSTKCQTKLSQLQTKLHSYQHDVNSCKDLSDWVDICGQTGFMNAITKAVRKDIFAQWEHFSGSFFFPVPEPTNGEGMYDGDQREYRQHLVKHIIKYVYGESNA